MEREQSTGPALVEVRAGRTSITGLLAAVAPEVATVELPDEHRAALQVGERYWLTFRGRRPYASSIRLRARLAELPAGASAGRFEIRLEDSIALSALVELRGALRVAPPADAPPAIEVSEPDGPPAAGTVECLSRTGLSVRLPAEVPFRPGDPIRLRFRLDGVSGLFDVEAVVRNRDDSPEGARLGCELVERRDVEFGRCRKGLDAYVADRLAAMLRELHARAS